MLCSWEYNLFDEEERYIYAFYRFYGPKTNNKANVILKHLFKQ